MILFLLGSFGSLSGQPPLEVAEQYHHQARDLSDPDSALYYLKLALQIRQKYNAPLIDCAKTSFNIGHIYRGVGEFEEARKYYKKVIAWGDDRLKSKAYLALGKIENELRAEATALEYYQLAASYAKPKHSREHINAIIDWISLRLNESLPDSILHTLARELKANIEIMRRDSILREEIDSSNLASLHDLLGISYLYLDRCKACEEQQRMAMNLEKEADFQVERLGNMAICYARNGNSKYALRLLEEARELISGADATQSFASTLDNYALIYFQEGHLDSAALYSEKAIHALVGDHFDVLERKQYLDLEAGIQARLIIYYERLLQIIAKRDDPNSEDLNRVFMMLDHLLDQIRLSHIWYHDKQYWQDQSMHIYDQAIWHFSALEDWSSLFYFLEKSKAISLKEHFVRAAQAHHQSDSLFHRERKIYHKLSALGDKEEEGQTDSLVYYKNQYGAILRSINRRNQKYFTDRAPIALKAIQSGLTRDSRVLIYHAYAKKGLGMLIGPNEILLKELAIDTIGHLVNQCRQWLQKSPLNLSIEQAKARTDYLQDALDLLSSILLFDNLTGDHLTIVPAGSMHLIPFSLLTDHLHQERTSDFAVRISPSLGILDLMQTFKTDRRDWLGIAPEFSVGSRNYSPLPHSHEEVKTLAQITGGKSYYEPIPEDQFYDKITNVGVVHLATHARVSPKYVEASIIALGSINEGVVYTTTFADILYKAPPLNMAVLSACETASGHLATGEGLVSLATSFAGSGTSSIVASLWQVDDRATRQIMEYFYKNLKEGQRKSEALVNAQQEYRDESDPVYADPYFWAPFIIIGDDSPLTFYEPYPWWMVVGLLLLLTGGLLIYRVSRLT